MGTWGYMGDDDGGHWLVLFCYLIFLLIPLYPPSASHFLSRFTTSSLLISFLQGFSHSCQLLPPVPATSVPSISVPHIPHQPFPLLPHFLSPTLSFQPPFHIFLSCILTLCPFSSPISPHLSAAFSAPLLPILRFSRSFPLTFSRSFPPHVFLPFPSYFPHIFLLFSLFFPTLPPHVFLPFPPHFHTSSLQFSHFFTSHFPTFSPHISPPFSSHIFPPFPLTSSRHFPSTLCPNFCPLFQLFLSLPDVIFCPLFTPICHFFQHILFPLFCSLSCLFLPSTSCHLFQPFLSHFPTVSSHIFPLISIPSPLSFLTHFPSFLSAFTHLSFQFFSPFSLPHSSHFGFPFPPSLSLFSAPLPPYFIPSPLRP